MIGPVARAPQFTKACAIVGRRVVAATFAFVAFLLVSCDRSPVSAIGGDRSNVLLIVVDTLRWDHLGSYGADRETSPAIDALAADGVRFSSAYATAPWTLPSVASMLTGHYPSSHGAINIGSKLPKKSLSLAEIYKSQGYETAGVASNNLLTSRRGFGQGFDEYRAVLGKRPGIPAEQGGDGHEVISTEQVTRLSRDLLARFVETPDPFFLFVHYFDPHYTYKRHPGHSFAADTAGRLDGSEAFEELPFDDLSPEETSFLIDLYDGEIRHTDEGIGRLVDQLREIGAYDNTLIVVTADHGEEFMERGAIGHTSHLYEEVMHVPLIVRDPRRARRGVVEETVSLVSLAPTILELTGIDPTPYRFQGSSFAGLLESTEAIQPDPVYFEVDFTAHKRAIISKGYKLIRDRDGTLELFDLKRDPGELDNLAPAHPETVARMTSMLDRQESLAKTGAAASETMTLSEEERASFRDLGYLE